MSTSHVSFFHAARCAASVLAALVSGAVMAQTSKLDANCAPQLNRLQQRLYQRANEGPDVLRNFMFIRRGILQLDIYDTGVWANSVHEARAVCMMKLAQAQQSPQVAAQAKALAP